MAINFAKTDYSGHAPEIWRGEAKILPGGFKPVATQNLPVGTVLFRGTPLYVDFDNHTAAVCKTALVVTGGTTTKPRVAKGHYFAVGDRVMAVGTADKSPLITDIDTTNAGYDTITLASAITGLAADAVLVECSEYVAAGSGTDAVNAAPLYAPNAVLGAVKEFTGKGIDTLDAAYECLVLKKHLKYPLLDAWFNAGSPCLKLNPNILFITQ